MKHPIPEYIPSAVGLGSKTKLVVTSRSSTPIPPREGKNYKKNPVNDKDTDERRRDIYFLRKLIEIYGGRSFSRWNLDAGRVNRVWCDDILIVSRDHSDTDVNAQMRVDLRLAEALIKRMGDNI